MVIDLSKLKIKTSTEELQSIHNSFKEAKSQVSFWGTRYISYQGLEINLSDLAEKVSSIANLATKENLEAKERLLWVKISNKITMFYDETDKIGKAKCFITRIIVV